MRTTLTQPQANTQSSYNSSILSRVALPPLFIFITAVIFLTQSGGVGFWKGSHGWNSAHGLAIMTHATPQNLFVGYAFADHSASGHTGYIYFDRYPFFFSASMQALMSLTDNLATKVWLVRQVMNAIFAATILLAFLIVRRLVENAYLALAITLLAFAGYNLVYYRDMIHYDQPALLGMMLLLYAIIVYKQGGKRRWLYLAALVAVSMGRGYASFFILGLWFVWEAASLLLRRDLNIVQRIRHIVAHDVTRVLVIALVWVVALLSYNIVVEAWQRGVSLEQTSVVESARRRLPFGHEGGRNTTTASEDIAPPWGEFIALELERIIRWFTPLNLGWDDGEIAAWALPVGLLALAVSAIYITRLRGNKRLLAYLMAFSGLVWIAFMINLTATHEFTTMYALSFALIFYTALLHGLGRYRFAPLILLALSLGIFTFQHYRVYAENVDEIRRYDVYTEDYNRIYHAIEGDKRNIYHTFPNNCAIENSKCFVLGFYLGDNYITRDYSIADYVLTGSVYHTDKPFLMPGDSEGLRLVSRSLTPDNQVAYLFDTTSAEVRHIPEDAQTLFRFGDVLALQQWELKDSVEVQPCQRIAIESWWQMIDSPPYTYSMQIAMVDSGGQPVSAANSQLTTLSTRLWIPDAWFLDARTLAVPCDAPPGEYPLVMSVYHPDTVTETGSLPVSLPDGTPSNDYVYLTTLFVR